MFNLAIERNSQPGMTPDLKELNDRIEDSKVEDSG